MHGCYVLLVVYARVEFLIRIQELTHVRSCYVEHLPIVFSKAALQKRGSMELMEPPLDPPLRFIRSEDRLMHLKYLL